MRNTYLILALLLGAASCKKKEDTIPVSPVTSYVPLDFNMISVKNARWYVHTQGQMLSGKEPAGTPGLATWDGKSYDTALHIYNVITPTGKTQQTNGYYYYEFNCTGTTTHTVDKSYRPSVKSLKFYLRLDTASQRIYYFPGAGSEQLVVNFSAEEDSLLVKPFTRWREMTVMPKDSIITKDNMCLKRWMVQNIYDPSLQYFYKAIGVGCYSSIAPLSLLTANQGQVRSVSFVYMSDSLSFEYPVQK